MHRYKESKKLKMKIFIPVLIVAGYIAGFYVGKDNNNINNYSNAAYQNKYLNEYITDSSDLSKEINDLLEKKKKLQKKNGYNISELLLVIVSHNNEIELHILCPSSSKTGWYHELNNKFEIDYSSIYRQGYNISNIPIYTYNAAGNLMMLGNTYIVESYPLASHLSSDELEVIAENNGKINHSNLEIILDNVRVTYNAETEDKIFQYSSNN